MRLSIVDKGISDTVIAAYHHDHTFLDLRCSKEVSKGLKAI